MDPFEFVDLRSWTIIKISGPQKLDYLNGIVTFELEGLASKGFMRCAFLTHNAKIRSIYWIVEINESYIFYCPPVFKDNLIEDLLKYKLSMDVKLEDITTEIFPLYLQINEGSNPIQGLSINSSSKFVNLEQEPKNLISYEYYKTQLIIGGVTPPNLMLNQIPYEVGINDAISLNKGCFLGQEPISRMFNRGKPRKYLYTIQSGSDLELSNVSQSDENVGEILQVVNYNDLFYGIAYIKSTQTDFEELKQGNYEISNVRRIGNYPEIIR